jgi:hypothetical protein
MEKPEQPNIGDIYFTKRGGYIIVTKIDDDDIVYYRDCHKSGGSPREHRDLTIRGSWRSQRLGIERFKRFAVAYHGFVKYGKYAEEREARNAVILAKAVFNWQRQIAVKVRHVKAPQLSEHKWWNE